LLGITQHTTGVLNVLSLANLQLLLGNLDVAGGGVNPLRGQNNVQGACDMGALPDVFPGYQLVTDAAAREQFARAWALQGADGRPELTPRFGDTPGGIVVELIHQAGEGKVRALYILGEEPMMTDPDVNHIRRCLEACEFLVLQESFPLQTAPFTDVLLPGTSWAEKRGTFTNTERRVQLVRQAIAPMGEARPDWAIIAAVARRALERQGLTPVGPQAGWTYTSPAEIMDEIAQRVHGRSRRGEVTAEAVVTARVAPGVILGNFHFPGEQNVNNLTIAALDPVAKIPEYKVCAVRIEPAEGESFG
jgi:formate dehydrogenase major subunit/formate dehydrogenase alpha subunit